MEGGGQLTLAGTGSYNGGTVVISGKLILASNTALAEGTSLTVGAGGTSIFASSGAAAPANDTTLAAETTAAVPEPAAPALLAAGLLTGLGVWRRLPGSSRARRSCPQGGAIMLLALLWTWCSQPCQAQVSGTGSGGVTYTMEDVFSDGAYDAFTDLTRYDGRWYLVFRTGSLMAFRRPVNRAAMSA